MLVRAAGSEAAGRLHWFAEIGSTNDWLLAREDLHARVCIAEAQSAGRGRRGRSWRAAPGGAILFSIGWQLDDENADGLSLVSGLAAVEALRNCGVDKIGLKWPNDLVTVAGNKKLGGVLTELRGRECVIGLGLNVMMPDEIPGAASLQSLGHEVDRDEIAAALIISHCKFLRRFCRGGFAQFAGDWQRLNVHRDCAVTVTSPRETFAGIARGVDKSGALIVEQNHARRRVVSGLVSLRGQKVS